MKITPAFPGNMAAVKESWSNEQSWPMRLGLLYFFTKHITIPDSERPELRKWMLDVCREIVSVLIELDNPNHEERCDRCSDFHYPPKDGNPGYGFILSANTVVETLVAGLRTATCHLLSIRQQAMANLILMETWKVRRDAEAALVATDEIFQFILGARRWIKLDQEPMRKLLKQLLHDYRFCYSVNFGWKFHPFSPEPGQQSLPDIWYDIAILSASGEISYGDPQIENAVMRFVQKHVRPRENQRPFKLSHLSKNLGGVEAYAAELLMKRLATSGRLDDVIAFTTTS